MNKEPALTIGAISTAVAAILAALVAFGIDLTTSQQLAVLGVIATVGPLVVAWLTRGRVSPSASVVAQVVDGKVVAGPALAAVDVGKPVTVAATE
jgi:hypothetical protein